MCNEIWKIIFDFLHVIDLANLRCVCKRLREIALLNEKMRSYLVFSKNVFDLDFNHHLTLNQSLIGLVSILIYLTCYISDIEFFLYLNIFSVINFLHICFIVVGLKFHLVLVTSAHYCCSITHLLVFVHQLIITLNLRVLKIFFYKRHQRFLMLGRIIGLVLTFFMEVKKYMISSNLMIKV